MFVGWSYLAPFLNEKTVVRGEMACLRIESKSVPKVSFLHCLYSSSISADGWVLKVGRFQDVSLCLFAACLCSMPWAVVTCLDLYSSGSEDGKIHVWNGESGIKVAVLDGKHTGPITCLQFNPKFMTFASACSNIAFWFPTIDDWPAWCLAVFCTARGRK